MVCRRLLATILMGVSALTVSVAQEAQTTDYVVNGGFERQVKGKLLGWEFYFWPKRPGIMKHFQASQEQVKSGEWSLKIAVEEPVKPEEGKNVAYVYFNGNIVKEATRVMTKDLVFSAWVYVPENARPGTVQLRLRQWGKNTKGKTVFRADVCMLSVTGKPAEWVKAKKAGRLKPNVNFLDMQCNVRVDRQPVTMYVDDVSLVIAEGQ